MKRTKKQDTTQGSIRYRAPSPAAYAKRVKQVAELLARFTPKQLDMFGSIAQKVGGVRIIDVLPGESESDAIMRGMKDRLDEPQPAAAAPPKKPTEESTMPKQPKKNEAKRDPRLPKVGTVLEGTFKGKTYRCIVQADGFKTGKEVFPTLSAAAKAASNQKTVNGFLFWGLSKKT